MAALELPPVVARGSVIVTTRYTGGSVIVTTLYTGGSVIVTTGVARGSVHATTSYTRVVAFELPQVERVAASIPRVTVVVAS